mgnify:CR=1 FL=1
MILTNRSIMAKSSVDRPINMQYRVTSMDIFLSEEPPSKKLKNILALKKLIGYLGKGGVL